MESLGQGVYAFYILIDIAKLPCKKVAPIYNPINIYELPISSEPHWLHVLSDL
jgi:hypothetical protein